LKLLSKRKRTGSPKTRAKNTTTENSAMRALSHLNLTLGRLNGAEFAFMEGWPESLSKF
jgi:hypothetical protein